MQMVERGANIDIVFRNGLKDFEVLPPPDVWDNIHPVMKNKQSHFNIISIAAAVTILVSVSFLTYKLIKGVLTEPEETFVAFNVQSVPALHAPASVRDISDTGNRDQFLLNVSGQLNKNNTELQKTTLLENNAFYTDLLISEKNIFPISNQELRGPVEMIPAEVVFNPSRERTFHFNKTKELDLAELSMNSIPDRWSVAALASPTYYSSFNLGNDELSKILMESEKPIISYSGGIAFSYKINKRFSIQTGLAYASMGQKVDGINSFGGFQKYVDSKGSHNFKVLTTAGIISTSNDDVYLIASSGSADRVETNYNINVFDPEKASLEYINNTIEQNFSYIEFPISVRYKVVDKKIDLNMIGGISYNFLINNSVYTVTNGNKYQIGETEGLNPLSLSSSLGMGMEYSISDNFSLNLEPIFKYFLNSYNSPTSTKIHPYSFGVFSGLSYRF